MNLHQLKIKKIYSYLLLILILLILYIFENISIFAFCNTAQYIYIIKPLCFAIIIVYGISLPEVITECKMRYKKEVFWWVVYSAFIFVAVMYIGGLLDGFGKTPYAVTFKGYFTNLIYFGTAIIAKENVRSIIVNGISKKYKIYVIIGVTLFLTFYDIKLKNFYNLKTKIEIIEFIGEDILINLSINVLLTYLVSVGGAKFSTTYLCIIQGVNIFSPILPDLMWMTKTFLSVICIVLTISSIQYINSKINKKVIVKSDKSNNSFSMALSSITGVLIIWFTIGVFPIYPSVIVTGSMKPSIHPGDVVMVEKLKDDNVKIGDIVKYKADDIYIVHRIISMKNVNGQKLYKTKGDNNSKADSKMVNIKDIKGKVIKVVPKIGWPTILLRDSNVEKERVEF